MALTMEEQQAIILSLARGRALTAANKQQIHDNTYERGEQQRGRQPAFDDPGSKAVRDGFYVHEADELLDWAEEVEEGGHDPIVRLMISGHLIVVGMRSTPKTPGSTERSDDKGMIPVLRWGEDVTGTANSGS